MYCIHLQLKSILKKERKQVPENEFTVSERLVCKLVIIYQKNHKLMNRLPVENAQEVGTEKVIFQPRYKGCSASRGEKILSRDKSPGKTVRLQSRVNQATKVLEHWAKEFEIRLIGDTKTRKESKVIIFEFWKCFCIPNVGAV